MWKDLTLEEKGKVMREAMKKGNYSLARIAQEYDDGLARRNVAPSYASGGHLHQATQSRLMTDDDIERRLQQMYANDWPVQDNTTYLEPIVTPYVKNEYYNSLNGIAA